MSGCSSFFGGTDAGGGADAQLSLSFTVCLCLCLAAQMCASLGGYTSQMERKV